MILQSIKKEMRAIVALSVMIGAVVLMIVIQQGTLVDVLIYLITAMWVLAQTMEGHLRYQIASNNQVPMEWDNEKEFRNYILFAIGMSLGWIITYLANMAVGAFFTLLLPNSSHHPSKGPVR